MSAKDMWKSETMLYCEMHLKKDYAFATLQSILDHKAVHFCDMTPDIEPFERPYAANVVKITDLEGKLQSLRSQIEHSDIRIPAQRQASDVSLLQLETEFNNTLAEVKELKASIQQSQEILMTLQEELHVHKSNVKVTSFKANESVLDSDNAEKLQNLLFSVPKKELSACLRGLFKSTFGFLEYQTEDFINDKELISAYLTGSESFTKCSRIIESLSGKIYQLNGESLDETEKKYNQVLQSVKASTERLDKLFISKAVYIDHWTQILNTHKIINHTLNLFRFNDQDLMCRCYVPEKMLEIVKMGIESINGRNKILGNSVKILEESELSPVERKAEPPTLFRRNKYTAVFENIVNSYGTPSYKEINPAFFYLYHFPFTFAIMFGDVGHGIINAIISLLMLVFEKKLSNIHNDMFELVFMGRYIIFLMSCFSILTGLMYNDCFSLAFNLFGTKYDIQNLPAHKGDTPVYHFGIDPVWRWAGNSMIFLNSYKMKLSVIIGVLQMLFGLILKLVNLISNKRYHEIFLSWIPEFVFMVDFFGYMVFCIIYKFFVSWPNTPDRPNDTPSSDDPAAPALINMLIEIFLSPGSIDDANQLFSDKALEEKLEMAIFVVAVIMVIWLAVASPVYDAIELKRHPDPEVGLGDIVVQEVINTIEYVLSCISHTASYLRLWALSLAHSQLADVFFEELIGISRGLVKEGKTATYFLSGLSYFVTYGGFFGATIGVLCLMEYLSAFLHCLRLCWIEFNSKFYEAEGYDFEGFGLPEVQCIEVSAEITRNE